MKAPARLSTKELQSLLEDCLGQVPFAALGRIKAEPEKMIGRPDAVADVLVDRQTWKLLIEQKTSGELRYLRDAVEKLKALTGEKSNAYGLLIAPYISASGSQLLSEQGVGFLDRCGNCLLSFGGIFIEHRGNPNRFARGRQQNSLFTPKASRIIRALLKDPGHAWKVTDLAGEAEVSNALVTHVKKLLAEQEWTGKQPSQLMLSDPRAVLKEWSNHYSFRKNRVRRYYSLDAVPDVESRLMDAADRHKQCVALTGMSAAARYGAFAQYKRVAAFCEGPPDELASTCGLKEVTSGENVWLLEPYDAGVFYDSRRFGDSLVVSPIQLYLDLFHIKGRGEDVAQMVFENVLEKTW